MSERAAAVEAPRVRRGVERPGRLCDCGDHAFAPLTKGYMTMVSPEDIGVFDRKWTVRLNGRGHVAAVRMLSDQRTLQGLHRLIAAAPEGKVVDHINGDPLDNRRFNLRVCDQRQNAWNKRPKRNKTGGLPKGVYRNKKKFSAFIKSRDGLQYLGTFEKAEDAGLAYASAAIRLFGEFARTK